MQRNFTQLFWRCHSACAIYTGGFLAFILITGAFAVFAEQIYRWENRALFRTGAESFNPAVLPEAAARSTAELAKDGSQPGLGSLALPELPGDPIRAKFFNRGHRPVPFKFNQPWYSRSVLLHPETGEVLGVVRDDHSLADYLRTVHVRIFAGTPGRNFVGLFGLALAFLCLTGIAMLARFLGGRALWIIRRTTARATNADLHKLIGFVLLLPALMFALTGFWLGMQGRLMQWFSIERPEAYEREALITPEADQALAVDPVALLARVKVEHPRLVPQEIRWSDDGSRTVRVQGRIPGTLYERLSQGVIFDKTDLAVLKRIDTPQSSWNEKLFYLQEGLHFGDFGGLPVQILYLVMGLLLGGLPLTGYAIHRLRTRQSLVPMWGWAGFVCAYLVTTIMLLKTQGLIVTMSYGTVSLWLFVFGLVVYWLLAGIRQHRRQRAHVQHRRCVTDKISQSTVSGHRM